MRVDELVMYRDKQDIYVHFHPDERSFIDQVDDWLQRVRRDHAIKLTDFLDPRQQFIVQSLTNRYDDIQVLFDGGYEDAERKRGWIAPDYRRAEDAEFNISVLSITSNDRKLADLDHGDYMGAILGLGLKRDKIGDIHVLAEGCHCLAADETIDYLDVHLRQVHRVNVLTEIVSINELNVGPVTLDEITFTAPSLRLDAIISEATRQSRSKVMLPIKAGHCRVNWKVETDPAASLSEGDLISLKGFGRYKILTIGGKSRKDRIHISVGKYT